MAVVTETQAAPGPLQHLHHVALLVHLDRKHATIDVLVIVAADCLAEAIVKTLESIGQDAVEANQNRKIQSSLDQLINQYLEIDGIPRVTIR